MLTDNTRKYLLGFNFKTERLTKVLQQLSVINMKIGTAYRRARRSLQCCPVTEHWYRIIIFSSFMSLMRGAVLEWLEHLGYGADSRRIA